jgi:hypothetical protein
MLVAPRLSTAAPAVIRADEINCDQIQKKIERSGYVHLSTTNVFIYDRYVSDARFCDRRELIEPAFVPTADSPQCLVGYRCVLGADHQ